jgi:ribosomal-protein-alanine N-acetyltransferase
MTPLNLTLRYMRIPDLPQVMQIDQASFRPVWPERSYRFEINESTVSYMVVLAQSDGSMNPPARPWWQFFPRRSSNGSTAPATILGYGGLWNIAEEAHVSTIASHPGYRGKGYGEVLLAGMVRRAVQLKADYVVLEVRVSNTVAQRLYRKYGFEVHDIKRDYYQYDREDAYDMRLQLSPANIQRVEQLYQTVQQRVPFIDKYSRVLHPRLKK